MILQLWCLRLSSLARLRLYNQTSAELTNLFTVLNSVAPPSAHEWLFDHILPFELEVMYARIKYWAGDHMGFLDALNGLLRKCRTKARAAKGDNTVRSMWQERGARVCLITASQLMEMKVSRFDFGLFVPFFISQGTLGRISRRQPTSLNHCVTKVLQFQHPLSNPP